MENKSLAATKKATSGVGLKSIEDIVRGAADALGEALPAHMNPERLVRIALTTMRLNPALYNCTPQSFIGALFQSAQLGLEPNIEGQAYIIPFNNSKKTDKGWTKVLEAQFIIGYKGYVELFYRHEKSVSLHMDMVFEDDLFDFEYGSNPFLKHKPSLTGRTGEPYAYYSIALLTGGGCDFKVMSKNECLQHAKKNSKTFDKKKGKFYEGSPYVTDFDAMAMKTTIRQLSKLLPKSIELQRALAMDETVKRQAAVDMSQIRDETNSIDSDTTEPSAGAGVKSDPPGSSPSAAGANLETDPAKIEKMWDES